MSIPGSGPAQKRRAIERRDTLVTLIALAIWLGLSLLGQELFIDQNERLDAGAIFISGGGPILIISALHLLFRRILSWGLLIRLLVGILFVGSGVGELTDLDKGVIWGPVGIAALVVVVGMILLLIFRRRGNHAPTS
jgi:membrane protease YdiL (CAAX protease family)